MRGMHRGTSFLRPVSCRASRYIIVVALGVGCAPQPQFQPKVEDEGRFLVHVVDVPGQKIATLCNWYSGRRDCEGVIKDENSFVDLDNLQIGDRVYFPFSVVTRVEAYQPGVAASHTVNEAQPAVPPIAQGDDETFDLSGGRQEGRSQEQTQPEALDPLEEVMTRNEAAARRQPPPAPNQPGESTKTNTDKQGLETFDLQDDAEVQDPNSVSSASGVGQAHTRPQQAAESVNQSAGIDRSVPLDGGPSNYPGGAGLGSAE